MLVMWSMSAASLCIRSSLRWIVTPSLLLAAGVSCVSAADSPRSALPSPVMQILERHGIPLRDISIYAQEIGQPAPFLSVRADAPHNPASTIKLLTTLAALEELGPAYAWKTEVYATAPIRKGALDGDLYLKGYGDPYLVAEYFWRMLRGLRATGLTEIAGDLVLDQSFFAPEPDDPGEFDGRPLRAYNVLPHALLVNFQAVRIQFLPQTERLRIVVDPVPADVEVDNRTRLTRGRCRGWAGRLRMRLLRHDDRTRIAFGGSYSAACGEHEIYRAIAEPAAQIFGTFKSLWGAQGGVIRGGVREGAVPPEARLLYRADSLPLADIIRLINKFSNNVMTRQVLITLGAERMGAPGSAEKGIAAVRAWLRMRGLDFSELVLDNGAGLSRKVRISARHLVRLLLAGYESPYMPEFMSSLPIASMDGTLRGRFGGSELEGRMHLKTGSLNGVHAIAGYLLDRRGRRIALASMQSHPWADSYVGERVEDELLGWIYERP